MAAESITTAENTTAMGNTESTQSIAAILNLEWSSRSIRISGYPMEAGASSTAVPRKKRRNPIGKRLNGN
jgi:hypothetical protein